MTSDSFGSSSVYDSTIVLKLPWASNASCGVCSIKQKPYPELLQEKPFSMLVSSEAEGHALNVFEGLLSGGQDL